MTNAGNFNRLLRFKFKFPQKRKEGSGIKRGFYEEALILVSKDLLCINEPQCATKIEFIVSQSVEKNAVLDFKSHYLTVRVFRN